MGRCRRCDRSGIFVFTDRFGLCARCRTVVALDLTDRAAGLNECIELVDTSKDLPTRIARCDEAIEHLRYIRDTYERRGINVLDPPADDQLAKLRWARDECFADDVKIKLDSARRKAGDATTAEERADAFAEVLDVISEHRPQMRAPSRLDAYQAEAERAIQDAQA